MQDKIQKKLFQGFIFLHILYHAGKEPIYGRFMLEELSHHGYALSPGTLYPILYQLEEAGLLRRFEKNVKGKIRKYYEITPKGSKELERAKKYLQELTDELRGEKA